MFVLLLILFGNLTAAKLKVSILSVVFLTEGTKVLQLLGGDNPVCGLGFIFLTHKDSSKQVCKEDGKKVT